MYIESHSACFTSLSGPTPFCARTEVVAAGQGSAAAPLSILTRQRGRRQCVAVVAQGVVAGGGCRGAGIPGGRAGTGGGHGVSHLGVGHAGCRQQEPGSSRQQQQQQQQQ